MTGKPDVLSGDMTGKPDVPGGLRAGKPDTEIYELAKKHWDSIAKPLDGLGRLEEITARIGAIQGRIDPSVSRRALVILCADHGIVEEGVSQCGSEVTYQVAANMGRSASGAGRMAAVAGAETIPVDVGIDADGDIPGVLGRKIRKGTRNFLKEPAMTRAEVLKAIEVGIDLAHSMKEKGYEILALGEMGIGNTTSSSAVSASLLGLPAADMTGRGAGLSDEGLARKIRIIDEAIQKYDLYHADALTVLQTVGGLEIAALCGVCIGSALCHIPVVMDGIITLTAGLCAQRLMPGTAEYMIASHSGREKACGRLIRELGLSPVIDADLIYGEGTGALMLFPLLDMALSVYAEGTSFDGLGMKAYERYES